MYKKYIIFIVSFIFFSFLVAPAFSATSGNSWERNDRLRLIQKKINALLSKKPRVHITTPTPTPTLIVIHAPTITIKASPTPLASTPQTDVTRYIMQEINKYRTSAGLSQVQTNSETCNFAKIRAKEISTKFNHDGFNERIKNHTLPYATWSKITENLAMTSNYKNVIGMWINSAGHAANMRADTPFVCVAQYGNFYAYEGMKP